MIYMSYVVKLSVEMSGNIEKLRMLRDHRMRRDLGNAYEKHLYYLRTSSN